MSVLSVYFNNCDLFPDLQNFNFKLPATFFKAIQEKDDRSLNIIFKAAILNIVAILFLPRHDLLNKTQGSNAHL